jgi:hypothetical protein
MAAPDRPETPSERTQRIDATTYRLAGQLLEAQSNMRAAIDSGSARYMEQAAQQLAEVARTVYTFDEAVAAERAVIRARATARGLGGTRPLYLFPLALAAFCVTACATIPPAPTRCYPADRTPAQLGGTDDSGDMGRVSHTGSCTAAEGR